MCSANHEELSIVSYRELEALLRDIESPTLYGETMILDIATQFTNLLQYRNLLQGTRICQDSEFKPGV